MARKEALACGPDPIGGDAATISLSGYELVRWDRIALARKGTSMSASNASDRPPCLRCGNSQPDGDYCEKCGSEMPSLEVQACSACGARGPSDAKFCSSCGTPIYGPSESPAPQEEPKSEVNRKPRAEGWNRRRVVAVVAPAAAHRHCGSGRRRNPSSRVASERGSSGYSHDDLHRPSTIDSVDNVHRQSGDDDDWLALDHFLNGCIEYAALRECGL